jgi:two-component system LytT family sensor kinase
MPDLKMKSNRIHWRLWLSIFIGWSLIGLAYTYNYSHFAPNYVKIFSPSPKFGEMLIWEMPYWILWAMLSPLVFWLTQRFRLERERLVRNALVHIVAFMALSLAHRAIYLLIDWELNVKAYTNLGFLSAVYNENFFFNLPNGFLCYVTILLASKYYYHYQEEELKISRLQAERVQAQWKAWKDQLQHHFLFNILNSISAKMNEDIEVAEEMFARLGDFLRMTLDNSGLQEVTLQEELEFLRCYLEIESVRFSDRLSVHIDIGPGTHEAMVPNLILQPIIENAIRHGIMMHDGEGRIDIHSRRENGQLYLEVQDNGPGLTTGSRPDQGPKRGLGFALVRSRLENLYGTSQRLSLSDASGRGLQVTLEIPYRLSDGVMAQEFNLSEETVAAI